MPLLRPTAILTSFDEPTLVRRLSLNLTLMAVVTGAALRLYRAVVLQFGWSNSWFWIAGTLLVGVAILCLMVTLHLGNYPVRAWAWRVPLFALVEVLTEISVSLMLVLVGLERSGSLTATFEDWTGMAQRIAWTRLIGIPIFAVVLAFVSTVARLIILPRKHGVM